MEQVQIVEVLQEIAGHLKALRFLAAIGVGVVIVAALKFLVQSR